ncbi:M28 family metallopeptidase [Lacinutrix sp. 5H-3-7-4]|uniref:M28 family metallopeptidase n=1 Tax=Lacinutrix sp. (strain 5H-3-7-4) TaxID=983544 RepID=UPI00020A3AA9|nr:M28 family metallopeptidase [Lacinutrix sp. 5H-3-7-4]AEH02035.1 peptidase M28 [Lacinutrix sp. 5H-3-7-4]
MKKVISLFSIATLLIACGTTNNTKTVNKKVEANPTTYANTITAQDLKTALYKYASDEFQGRETGQPGQKLAVEFLKNHYIKYGVPAAKQDGDYFQNVPLKLMSAPDITVTVNGKTFKQVDDIVSVGNGDTNKINTSEIIYAGYGIDDENYSSYTNMEDLTGKIVLIKNGEPKNEDGTFVISGTNEESKWSNFRQQFAAKKDAAQKRGAAAVFFYYPDVYKMIAFRYGASSGRLSLAQNNDSFYYFMINENLATSLVPDISKNTTTQAVATNMSLDFTNKSQEVSSENVAAVIKGTQKPDEYIIISAHLDHEGIKDGKIYNGADDDGSGTVAVLEIAEAFAKAKKDGNGPKRSIVFLNVTGEEKGLLGSRHYTDNDPIFPLANTVADLNIDMIGRTDPNREKKNRNYVYLIGSDKLSTELHEISEAVNTKYMNIDLDYKYNDENDPNRFYYRSDHYNFAKNNIPVIFYFNGTHADYHKPSDTVEKIEFDLLENRTRLVFYTAWELANRENRIIVDKATE